MPTNFIEPCHPTSAERPPAGPGWLHEVKWDGYRAQAHLRDGKAIIYTRNGQDWTRQFATIAAAVAKLRAKRAVLDGELIVLDKDGKADFQALRGAMDGRSSRLRLCAFDLLELDGVDLRPMPLAERKKRLGKLLRDAPSALMNVEALDAGGGDVFAAAPKLGLEGIVSKRASAPYRSGRSSIWVKVKCKRSDTFTVIAFADETGSHPPRVEALYVGRPKGRQIVYAGNIQVGLPLKAAAEMRTLLEPLIRPGKGVRRKVTRLEPKLEAEVSYSKHDCGRHAAAWHPEGIPARSLRRLPIEQIGCHVSSNVVDSAMRAH
jgi:bifunctional non-homologous end joining protein LigD